ncbi:MAG: hypothetical protein AAGH73_00060 [Pseudomonadota bacterium]
MDKKVATCCYCGTRAALVLRGSHRHELSCSSCGAPLHDLKMLPKRDAKTSGAVKRSRPPRPDKRDYYDSYRKPKKRKKKKGFGMKIMEELFDVIEDIID